MFCWTIFKTLSPYFPQILNSNNLIGPSEGKIMSSLFSFRVCKEAHSVILGFHFLERRREPPKLEKPVS